MSRDPQTSSLDRNAFNPLSNSPQSSKKAVYLCNLMKTWSKSADTSPVHSALREEPSDGAEVQDCGSCMPQGLTESNLDFGFRRQSDQDCWTGSNESFSDLDRGMTRGQGVIFFRPRSLSGSSQSQSDNELNESIVQLESQASSRSNSICAFGKSCENVYNASHGKKKYKSLPSRNTRSKSSGGMIIHKFSKKLSKLNLGGGGGGGGKGGEGSGSSKKKKSQANSASTLDTER